MPKELPQDDIDWLANLEKETGEWIQNQNPGAYHGLNFYSSKCKLTRDEINRIMKIAVDCKLPISISLVQFGFSVRIFHHPIYVGTDIIVAFYFQSSQFPVVGEKKDCHKAACEFLWPYITAPENLEVLQLYELPLPDKDPAYYYTQ